jgi:hypothetical protein
MTCSDFPSSNTFGIPLFSSTFLEGQFFLRGQHIVRDFLDIRGYHECCTFKTMACKTYTQAVDCSRNMKGQDIVEFTLPYFYLGA